MTDLDAPAFMESNGRKGLWQPLSFVKEKRGGVYLLEPYDPNKIPVLFIHGAGGTPQDWRYFISRLDRSKYQVWVYYYPTGLPIDLSAGWLNNFITELHHQYGFQQLAIAAHSMGGLVARRFIALNAAGPGGDYDTLLATFSTPFGGVPVAAPRPDARRLRRAELARPHAGQRVPALAAGPAAARGRAPPRVLRLSRRRQRLRQRRRDQRREPARRRGCARAHGFRTDHSDIIDSAPVFKSFAAAARRFRLKPGRNRAATPPAESWPA